MKSCLMFNDELEKLVPEPLQEVTPIFVVDGVG